MASKQVRRRGIAFTATAVIGLCCIAAASLPNRGLAAQDNDVLASSKAPALPLATAPHSYSSHILPRRSTSDLKLAPQGDRKAKTSLFLLACASVLYLTSFRRANNHVDWENAEADL